MDDDLPDEVFAQLKSKELGLWDVAQIAAGTGLAIYAMWAGILQPGFRKVPLKLQVPYIPASKGQVQNVMTLLRGRSGALVDLGSGDGRIVLEAHQRGFSPAVGYELNPWLIQLARYHAWRGGYHEKVMYRREDLWKVDLSQCKNITVFLAPSVFCQAGQAPYVDGFFDLAIEIRRRSFNINREQGTSLSLLQEKLQAELPDDALVVAGRFPFPDWKPCRVEGHGVDRAWAYSMKEHKHKQEQEKKQDGNKPT